MASVPFRRISYTEAVDILTTAIREKKKKFENAKVRKSSHAASYTEFLKVCSDTMPDIWGIASFQVTIELCKKLGLSSSKCCLAGEVGR